VPGAEHDVGKVLIHSYIAHIFHTSSVTKEISGEIMTTMTPRVKWLIDCPEEGYCRHNTTIPVHKVQISSPLSVTLPALQTTQQFQSVQTPQIPKWDPGSAHKELSV